MKKSLIALLLLTVGATGAHAGEPSLPRPGFNKIVGMARAMGGIRAILSLYGMQIRVEGERLEPEQTHTPGDPPLLIARYQMIHTQAFDEPKLHTQWSVKSLYPLSAERQYTEIINAHQGAIIGSDSLLNLPQSPMTSIRVASRTKQRLLESPLALIHQAAHHVDEVHVKGEYEQNGRRLLVVTLPGPNRPIRLFIDPRTQLPVKADTWEDDTVYGDARLEVFYDDWAEVNGIRVPTRLTHRLAGHIIHHQTRTNVQFDLEPDSGLFDIPDDLKTPPDPQRYAWGLRASQMFNRYLLMGVPFDIDQTSPGALTIKQLAPGVFHVLAPLHNSMVIEMRDHLIVLESPLYDERTQAVLAAIRTRWPDRPVKYLVASHFHHDHIGGIRGYGAMGATLITSALIEDDVEDIFKRTHSIYPDTFERNPRDVEIEGVEANEPRILTDGQRRVHIFEVPNRHAAGSLVTYIEDAKMVFVSDLYNPELFWAPLPPSFDGWSKDLLKGLRNAGLDIEFVAGAHGGVVSYQRFVDDVEATP